MLWRSITGKEPYSLCWTERQKTKTFNHLITELKFFSNQSPTIFEYHWFMEGSQASLFVLLVRATCRWRQVWRPGWMLLTGGKPVPVSLCPPQISRGLTRDQSQASAVTGRRLIAWAVGLKRWKLTWILVRDSVLTAQYTQSLGYKIADNWCYNNHYFFWKP